MRSGRSSRLSWKFLNKSNWNHSGRHSFHDVPALSYGHRVVDGKEAVHFLVRVKECLENSEISPICFLVLDYFSGAGIFALPF